MRVPITTSERELLQAHAETSALLGQLLVTNESALEASPLQCDDLRDSCATLLQRIGFDEAYLPTADGVILERLIDKLYVP